MRSVPASAIGVDRGAATKALMRPRSAGPVPIERTARIGFERAAERYERGRPEVPPDAVEALVHTLSISERSAVLELGAGTGKFSRLFGPRAGRYLALEPVPGMRALFRRQLPHIPLVAGVAEALPVRAGRFDAIVAVQAFHWFDASRAMEEMRRVLRPGGAVGLVWNARDESVDWVHQESRILDRYDEREPRYADGAWRAAWKDPPGFSPLELQTFSFVQRMDRATALDRFLSISFIASLDAERHAEAEAAIGSLLDTHPETAGRPEIELPYRCEVYTSHRLPGPT